MRRLLTILMIGVVALSGCATEKESQFKSLKELDEGKPQTPPEEVPLSAPLQMNDLKVGTGEAAAEGDTVLVHYTGWLYENGARTTQFDTSRKPGRSPFEVTIGITGVIRGWTQGLVGMKVGGVRQLIIPPELAYGARGKSPVIPPGATLEFEIEMVGLIR